MIEFLIWVVVMCVVFGLLYYIVTLLPLPDPFKQIAIIAVLLIFILVLLGSLTGYVPMRFPGR
jgi:hypothetical protein